LRLRLDWPSQRAAYDFEATKRLPIVKDIFLLMGIREPASPSARERCCIDLALRYKDLKLFRRQHLLRAYAETLAAGEIHQPLTRPTPSETMFRVGSPVQSPDLARLRRPCELPHHILILLASYLPIVFLRKLDSLNDLETLFVASPCGLTQRFETCQPDDAAAVA
jgi:hypothetical protein